MTSYCPSEDCNAGEEAGMLRKRAWSIEEDQKLLAYIKRYGIWNWNHMAKPAGLARSGKSCRLRWMNYLKPNLKHGNFTIEEEETIIRLQRKLGNRWAAIAEELNGRTDNEIKNYWNSHLRKLVVKYSKEADATANYRDISNITVSREPSSSSSGHGGSGSISDSPSPSGSSQEECCNPEGAEMLSEHTNRSLFNQVGNFNEQNPLLIPNSGGLYMTPEEDFQEAMFMISEAGGFRHISNSNTQETTLSSEYLVYDLWEN